MEVTQRMEALMQRAPLLPYESEDAAVDDVALVQCSEQLQRIMMKERPVAMSLCINRMGK